MTSRELSHLMKGMAPAIAQFVKQEIAKAVDDLVPRIKALEARPEIRYQGVHVDGESYQVGALVTRSGALWLAERRTDQRPGGTASGWKLVVKAGKA